MDLFGAISASECYKKKKKRLSDCIRNSISYEPAYVCRYQSIILAALKLIHVWNKAELTETERGGDLREGEISSQYMSELLQGCKYVTLSKDVECFWSLCKWI